MFRDIAVYIRHELYQLPILNKQSFRCILMKLLITQITLRATVRIKNQDILKINLYKNYLSYKRDVNEMSHKKSITTTKSAQNVSQSSRMKSNQ